MCEIERETETSTLRIDCNHTVKWSVGAGGNLLSALHFVAQKAFLCVDAGKCAPASTRSLFAGCAMKQFVIHANNIQK